MPANSHRVISTEGGGEGFFALCKEDLGTEFTIGRDELYDLLRANGLMLLKRRVHPRTTNSKHKLSSLRIDQAVRLYNEARPHQALLSKS